MDIPPAPEGLTVTAANPIRAGIAYRAQCTEHDCCRNRILYWTAASWDELVLRVFPAFYRHCQDMDALT